MVSQAEEADVLKRIFYAFAQHLIDRVTSSADRAVFPV